MFRMNGMLKLQEHNFMYVQDERYNAVPWMGKGVYVQDEPFVSFTWISINDVILTLVID